jgi:hypothetical protein
MKDATEELKRLSKRLPGMFLTLLQLLPEVYSLHMGTVLKEM